MKIIDLDELDDLKNVKDKNKKEPFSKEDVSSVSDAVYSESKEEDVKQEESEFFSEEILSAKLSKDRKKAEKDKKKNGEINPIREFISLIVSVILVVVITFLIVKFVGQKTEVSGSSMEYTLRNNDNLIVDKISYRFSEPKRYDIVVFPYEGISPREDENQVYYIKRIIGMPGETIQIKDGIIYINGEELKESYGKEVIEDPKKASKPLKIGEDEFFVLGDNRNHSSDSREYGCVKRKKLIGKAWMRIWPLGRFGILRHQ